MSLAVAVRASSLSQLYIVRQIQIQQLGAAQSVIMV